MSSFGALERTRAAPRWYEAAGGPLAILRAWARAVEGGPLDAGHFFPEDMPEQTAEAFSRFIAAAS